ncbi:helix-turn-helix domain-containing protein [Geomicrobium sp. JCM 19039]|uniref:helix-turn-helix domain-containing protein n=1 Tax=Geomicrobium sp. JCM 19039 TaxID=1460636 RepID=UPI001EE674D7|nr:helix-turn-helix domain-containing protein [Geomicrobium sp. JCM 19039]
MHNVLQFSLSMMDRRDTGLHTVHLPAPLGNHREHSRLKVGSLRSELNRAEYEVLSVALKNYENTIEGKRAAAQQLNISLATLYNKLKKHGMNP